MSIQFEVAIIGAGPGGLGAAINAANHNLSHILFERKEIGNTIYDYQLRKWVMAEPQKLPLRGEVKFDAGSREEILENWNAAILSHQINHLRSEVTAVKKVGDFFEITHSSGSCQAKNVVMAIGVQGTPRKLGVPGEDAKHVAYTLSDPDAFEDKDILVVGTGDAGIENALALCEKNRVSILNLGDDFPRAKEANASKIMDAIKKQKIFMFAHSSVAKVESSQCIINTPDGEVAAKCDHLIVRIGGVMPRKFLEACEIEFSSDDHFAVPVVDGKYQSNVKGLYLVGALIGYPLIKQCLNQGYEVIEHMMGNDVEPADQVLIEESLQELPGSAVENLELIRRALPLYRDLSEAQFRELIIESKVYCLKKGDIVFARNDYTDTFYSVVHGSVEIEINQDFKVAITQGNHFGEMGLLSGRRRSASARAAEDDCILLEAPRKQILKLMKSVTSVKRDLDELFMLRALETHVFPNADPIFLRQLVSKAELKSFKKNEVIFNEGDLGDVLYMIRKGSVKISKIDNTGKNITRTYVAAGNIVGEMALLHEEEFARSATATAAVACDTILIQKSDLQELLRKSPEVRKDIEELARSREVQNITSHLEEEQSALLDFMMKEGVTDADNVLIIDSDLCVGCDNCEAACAATHGGYSRLDRKGGKSFAQIQIPISCRHCENPLCMTDCPPDALSRQPNGEIVILDSCIGCGNCSHNCPYGVIQMVHEDAKPVGFNLFELFGFSKKSTQKDHGPAKAAKCDLCQTLPGGPACVRSCPTGAALRVNPNQLLKMAKRD